MAPAPVKGAKNPEAESQDDKPVPKKSLFEDSDSSGSEDDQEDGGATLGTSAELKINEEYARRFEHNKKREELHRLQEKYKSSGLGDEESEESSEDETEDDDAELITEELDAEISATLQAIKNKDPKIYDKNAVFYKPFDPDALPKKKEEKPMYLRDYHRERYLSGDIGADDDNGSAPNAPRTYAQEQDDIKKSIISEINAAAAAADEEEWSDDDAFIKPVKKDEAPAENGVHPSRKPNITLTEEDVANADKNPEEFLNKFIASRAWVPEDGGSKWQAFESDEGEDNGDLAEEFEHAYNMRFEDPEKSNEFLKTYSRSLAAARSVRKEELTGRKKKRALEKERKEAEKREREAERARLRRLKIEEASEKLAKIKKAAGMRGQKLTDEEWLKFLDDAWDDDKWEEEMKKRFGDDYYAEPDDMSLSEEEEDSEDEGGKKKKKKKKPKKPKWDDDIDINDIVPDFEDSAKPAITLSDEDAGAAEQEEDDGEATSDGEEDSDGERPAKKRKTSKEIKKERIRAKREARAELAKIEALVDTKMELENPRALQSLGKKATGGFRYRETSPQSFGLTARDILLAPSDAALNEFAGLKKLATFRDEEKKRRDRKKLGKKARLRKWRRETFGKEYEHTGPTFGFEALLANDNTDAKGKGKGKGTGANAVAAGSGADKKKGAAEGKPEPVNGIIEGERKKKRKRSKKKKSSAAMELDE
ncbi:hypothetical protein MYCTH_2303724 [Thermothelomyces thermophilus ATCC 42464]|uniref:Kri1-like C-terminal domain-containing protein n=1 Tax=Thermothelomyces thermophilus (strain ATCC 42464 / BCRC 31852 / DSM 1799) TaxID=573729 RepID=G2QDI9_THET4|nr:uncharacterized protein MYCTH_2303724 [Thermothelomyces thermophilus ATCC 42464]AEO57501.1 hypothetical protein MYCTH_2303724 [Thermothelomyces thermophilus ATCC 42464]